MENESNKGLHSIERSKLRGAKSRPARNRVDTDSEPQYQSRQRPRRGKKSVKRTIILILIIIAGGIGLVTTTFATAKLNLTLASAEVSVDGVFKSAISPLQKKDYIPYTMLGPYSSIKSGVVTKITKERQSTYSEGTITIYNENKSGERLDLVNRTRFQTENGSIYRISGKQIVPAGKTVNGEFVPGTKDVKVVSDSVGSLYNIDEVGVKFSIPGLGRYKEFSDSYALSKTKIIGGFSGEKFIPNAEEESSIRSKLRKEIEKELLETLAEELNTNTLSKKVVFENGKVIKYESLENEQTDEGVIIKEKGSLSSISFRISDMALLLSKLANSRIPENIVPETATVSKLNMEIIGEDFNLESSTEFEFRLSGSSKILWDVDQTVFLRDISDKSIEQVKEIIATQYPQITSVNMISVFPSWRSTFPSNKKKIEIKTGYSATQI